MRLFIFVFIRLSELKKEHKEAVELESEQTISLRKQLSILEDQASRDRFVWIFLDAGKVR